MDLLLTTYNASGTLATTTLLAGGEDLFSYFFKFFVILFGVVFIFLIFLILQKAIC